MTIKMEPSEFKTSPPLRTRHDRTCRTSNSSPSTTNRTSIGNNQVITLSEVINNIDIIGNQNLLTVDINNANIKVIGNGCTVKVYRGKGRIQVIGNNSTVFISDGIDANCVQCVGNKSRVLSFQMDNNHKSTNVETRDGRDTASDVRDCNLVDGDCNYLSAGSGNSNEASKNRKQSMKCPASRTCEDGESAKGSLKEAMCKVRHPNGLLHSFGSQGTVVQKHGYLYIDNCVTVKTGTTRTIPF